MFDLAKAFESTYNPSSGLYLRKDRLVTLIPEHMTGLRKKVLNLIRTYPAKLVVKILTEGYPTCPCCSRSITKPNMSGDKRDEFIKTCGRARCQQWYLSKGSAYGKLLQAKAKTGFAERLQPYMEVVKELDFAFLVRCTRCGRAKKRTTQTASAHCSCSKGEKMRETITANNAALKRRMLKELRDVLPSTRKITRVHPTKLMVDLHCTSCGTTETRWISHALKWGCACGLRDSLEKHWDSLRADSLEEAEDHCTQLGLKLLGSAGNGKYLVRCKCGTEFVPYSVTQLKHGCRPCATAAVSPQRVSASKKTCLARYGVEYPSQHPDVQAKVLASGYRTKPYSLNGRQLNVRGYEPQAIDYLLAKGIPAKHIYAGVEVSLQ